MSTATVSNSLPAVPEVNLNPEGFLTIRAGLFDYLIDGRMTARMLAIYVVMLHQCDWRTGVWHALLTAWRTRSAKKSLCGQFARI